MATILRSQQTFLPEVISEVEYTIEVEYTHEHFRYF